MEVIKHTSGKTIGSISVRNTLETMKVGDSWTTSQEEINLGYAQSCASKYGAETGKQFHISAPKELEEKIIIRRIA